MDHLWSLGHRSIMCVSDLRTYDGRLRIDAYERYMHERGAGEHARVYVTDQEPQPAYELGDRIFAGGLGATTAMFVTSDAAAVGIMTAAYQAGVRIPDDLSIVGYDDIDVAAYTIPPLTTVSQAGVDMGEAAAQLLIDMIDGDLDRNVVDDVVLEPTLVVRESSAVRT
jgi:LacI family transcriptional regulator